MRILLLNQTFYPDVAATAQHAHDLALDLVKQGHQVSVVTSRSIYGKKGAELPKREAVDGIEVYRVGASLFGKGSTFARLIDFLAFYVLATVQMISLPKHDVIVPFTTPPMIVCAAVLTKWIKRCKVVYWVMDLYPDIAVAHGILKPKGLVTKLLRGIHRLFAQRTDAVVALGTCMKDKLVAQGVDVDKVHVLTVWADASEITPTERADNTLAEQWGLGDDFIVMYSGNFGLAHDTETLKQAMLSLRDEPGLRFLFVGAGKGFEAIQQFAKDQSLTHTMFQPYQPRSELSQSLSLGDVHLVSQTDAMTGLLVPCKLFGILTAARPAIFIGHPDAYAWQLIEQHQLGRNIRCGNANELRTTILELKANRDQTRSTGQHARQVHIEHFDRPKATEAWTQLLEEIAE